MHYAALLLLFVLVISSPAQLLPPDGCIIHDDHLLSEVLNKNLSQILAKRQAPPFEALTLNGPLLHPSWGPEHCDKKDRIATTFFGTLELARYAMDSLRVNVANDVFQRYFQASSRYSVFKVFRAFLNQQVGLQATLGPANTLFKHAILGYVDLPRQWSPEKQGTCQNRGDWAYMVNFGAGQLANIGFLSVCPRAFARLPEEVDPPMMTSTEEDTCRCDDVMEKGYAWEERFERVAAARFSALQFPHCKRGGGFCGVHQSAARSVLGRFQP